MSRGPRKDYLLIINTYYRVKLYFIYAFGIYHQMYIYRSAV